MPSYSTCPICKQRRTSRFHTNKCSQLAREIGREETPKGITIIKPDFHVYKRRAGSQRSY